jgi:hypothetical protein
MKKFLIVILFMLPVLLWNACKDKVTEVDYNPNVLSSKDFIRAEDAIMEIFNAFLKGINDSLVANHGYGYIDNCSVTYYPADNSMTFGYGEVNRFCQDNKFRRGLYRGTFTGEIFIEGVTVTLITDSLYVDDLPVEAEVQITNLGLNGKSLPEYSLKVISTRIIADTLKMNGVNISTDYLMEWKEGSGTPEVHEDDIFYITGTASGVSSDGYEFSIQIQDTLINPIDCYWISQGFSQITVPSGTYKTGDIDYITEDGCYNKRNFTFNDNLFFDYIK